MNKQEIATQITLSAIQSGLLKNAHSINNPSNEANLKTSNDIAETIAVFFNTLMAKLEA